MALLSPKSLAGPGYIILNTLRAMNIISLLAVVAASAVMLVKTVINSNFFFFDAVSHVITASISTFLITSEVSLFRTYFATHWPLLSPAHGFVTLGSAMLVLGLNILGNLNKQATSQQNLGLGFWRIVIGSGILVMICGFFNIGASYIFRSKVLGVTARMVRAKGAVALTLQRQAEETKAWSFVTSNHGSPAKRSSPTLQHQKTPMTQQQPMEVQRPTTPSPLKNNNNNRKSEKFNPFRRFTAFGGNRTTLPSYHASSKEMEDSPSSKYSERPKREESTPRYGQALRYGEVDPPARPVLEISAPIGVNPQFGHLVRPDSCLHPSRSGMRGGMV